MGTKGKLIKDFFAVIFEIIMKMVKGILWITPVGLCSIIAGKIMIVADIAVVMSQLGWLILTVILGVLFYQFVVLQLVYFLVVRKNPFKYYLGVIQGKALLPFRRWMMIRSLPETISTILFCYFF